LFFRQDLQAGTQILAVGRILPCKLEAFPGNLWPIFLAV